MKTEFILAIIGGVLIGIASALPLWWQGRVAGASGLLSGLYSKLEKEKFESLFYILGLMIGAYALTFFVPLKSLPLGVDWKLVVGAFLVGFGARLGGGCTSGHGVCGMGRFSYRSIAATVLFLSTAMLVANLLRAFV